MRNRSSSRAVWTSLALSLACLVPVVSACSGGSDAVEADAEAGGSLPAPGREAAAQALEDGRVVIDVRTPEEYDAGHIDGATLVNFQGTEFADEVAALDPDDQYVVYCRSGNRSAQAAIEMRKVGLDVVDGGALTDMQASGWDTAA